MKLTNIPLSYNELLAAIHDLQFNKNSDFSNALEKMIFNEMLKFSKRELELFSKSEFTDDNNFYEKFKLLNSHLLMSVLLEKKVQWNDFSSYTHWIMSVIDEPTMNLYKVIFKIETNLTTNDEQNDNYFIDFIHHYCFDLDSNEKKILIEQFYIDWFDKLEKNIIKKLVYSAPTVTDGKKNKKNKDDQNINIYNFYLDKFKEREFDIKEINVNSLLPKYDGITKFSVSLISLNKIKFLSNFNLFINDFTYSFDNKTLYENILSNYDDYLNSTTKEIFKHLMIQVYNFKTSDPSINQKLFKMLDRFDENFRNIILYNKSNFDLKTTVPIKRKIHKL